VLASPQNLSADRASNMTEPKASFVLGDVSCKLHGLCTYFAAASMTATAFS
jgi:hypothetical protein